MGEMTIGRPNIPNDVLMQRLGIVGHMQSPQPVPIRPQGAVVQNPHVQAQQPSNLQPATIPPQAQAPKPMGPLPGPITMYEKLQEDSARALRQAAIAMTLPDTCCFKCKHFHSFVAGGSGMVINGVEKPAEEVTECRRYPPTNGAMGPVFVKVNKDHFCGEFSRKDSTQRNRMGAPEDSKGIAAQEALVDTYGFTEKEATEALKANGKDNPDGVQSQPIGVGENLRKKRGRPAKGVQGGSGSDPKKGKAKGGTVVQEHPQGV